MRTCKNCGKEFEPKFSTVQQVCSPKCAISYAKKKEKEKKKKLHDSVKTLNTLKSEAKTAFQKWVRMRDKDLPCISCGKVTASQWDGGHFKKAEIYSSVIFDERNVNKQCSYCNKHLHGNESEYRKGLIAKIGIKEVEDLEQKAKLTRYYKWTSHELIKIRDKYKLKIKELKKQ